MFDCYSERDAGFVKMKIADKKTNHCDKTKSSEHLMWIAGELFVVFSNRLILRQKLKKEQREGGKKIVLRGVLKDRSS